MGWGFGVGVRSDLRQPQQRVKRDAKKLLVGDHRADLGQRDQQHGQLVVGHDLGRAAAACLPSSKRTQARRTRRGSKRVETTRMQRMRPARSVDAPVGAGGGEERNGRAGDEVTGREGAGGGRQGAPLGLVPVDRRFARRPPGAAGRPCDPRTCGAAGSPRCGLAGC